MVLTAIRLNIEKNIASLPLPDADVRFIIKTIFYQMVIALPELQLFFV